MEDAQSAPVDDPSISLQESRSLCEGSDQELAQAVRFGDGEAFGELFRRHEKSATRFASFYTKDPYTAQDLVAEAFARVLQVLKNGGGPDTSFRGYLLTVLRNIVTEWARSSERQLPVPDVSIYERESAASASSEALRNLDYSLVVEAFASLPPRWQEVLFYTVIHAEEPAAVARHVGLRPNSVAALAYRAREGLRQAYLTVHLRRRGEFPACDYFIPRFAANLRGRLGEAGSVVLHSHLDDCNRCKDMYEEARDLNALL
ncbi:RNA polymerase sigma factor [Kitasatospora kifunensis]|uniref:RNA polymerase sigma factor n=1 Tax=Kitasatospora kifunensis TaxID=58351 RepID=UPI0028ADEFA3|nr:sigma-70 family RNA polymerase sigma factor [Kitasatospora kifunensis]